MGPRVPRSSLVLLVLLLLLLTLTTTVKARFGDRIEPRIIKTTASPAVPVYHHEEEPQVEVHPSSDADVYEIEPAPAEAERRSGHTEAHRLEMSTEFFAIPERSTSTLPSIPAVVEEEENIATVVNATAPPLSSGGLRAEPWALPLLALSSLVMLSMAAFEVFILCKVWRTAPSRRHLFLGQMLLLGLFACAAQGAVLSAAPTPVTCACVRFGAGVSLALVFSALLVKCVFLISLDTGVYLPAPYQVLLLFFAVMTQVAIGVQWLSGTPPKVLPVVSPTIAKCKAPFNDLLISFLYVGFLAAFVGILAVKSRGIRDNHKEAGYIAWAAGGAALLAAGWAGGALLAAPRHRDGCLGFGLALTAAFIFLVMFAPKGRQLAALGKDASAVDREERLSSLSRAGSGYSPSFFHFKPVKYGVVGSGPSPPVAGTPRKQAIPPPPADCYPAALARLYCYPGMPPLHPYAPPPCHFYYPPPPQHRLPPGLLMRSDDGNMYTTLEPTFSSNPNVYFQRSDGGVHPGMMY